MADIEIFLEWAGRDLVFEGRGRADTRALIDGNSRESASPVESLLLSLASCMAADLIDIAGKMRVPFDAVQVHATGDRRPEPPRRYTAMRLVFTADGVDPADSDKLQRALDLSRDKYCSVLHTLRSDVPIDFELVLNPNGRSQEGPSE